MLPLFRPHSTVFTIPNGNYINSQPPAGFVPAGGSCEKCLFIGLTDSSVAALGSLIYEGAGKLPILGNLTEGVYIKVFFSPRHRYAQPPPLTSAGGKASIIVSKLNSNLLLIDLTQAVALRKNCGGTAAQRLDGLRVTVGHSLL